VDGILTTRVARTLVDLAGILHPLRAERAVDSCLGSGLVTLDSLGATFSDLAGRGRKGIAVMRVVLDERPGSYVAPESELESRFLHLAHLGGLPEPVRQLNTGDDANWIGRVDFAYPDARLLVELDGRANHTSKLDRETDAGRDARLVAAGWRRIERFTWDDITRRGDAAVERLRLAMTGEPSNR